MTTKSKYIGRIDDGIWEVVDCKMFDKERNYRYVLQNQLNQNKVIVSHNAIVKLENHQTTVSSVIHQHIIRKRTAKKPTLVY